MKRKIYDTLTETELAVVWDYIVKGTFEGSLETQRQLIADYKEDIRKYAEGIDQTRILNVFNRITPQLARENKKFQISKVASGARFKDYRGCIEWLVDAGMVNICYCMSFPELPYFWVQKMGQVFLIILA